MAKDVEANVEIVAEFTQYILEAMDAYLKDKPMSTVDVFMSVHNAHLMMVQEIANRWEPVTPKQHTYRMADLTFRKAIRELRMPSKIVKE